MERILFPVLILETLLTVVIFVSFSFYSGPTSNKTRTEVEKALDEMRSTAEDLDGPIPTLHESSETAMSALIISLGGAMSATKIGSIRASARCSRFVRSAKVIDVFKDTALFGKVYQLHIDWDPYASVASQMQLINSSAGKHKLKGPLLVFVVGGLWSMYDADIARGQDASRLVGSQVAGSLWKLLIALNERYFHQVHYLGSGLSPDFKESAMAEFYWSFNKTLIQRFDAEQSNIPAGLSKVFHLLDFYSPPTAENCPWGECESTNGAMVPTESERFVTTFAHRLGHYMLLYCLEAAQTNPFAVRRALSELSESGSPLRKNKK